MVPEMLSSLSALKKTVDLLRIGVDARDDSKVKAALADFTEKYMPALTAAAGATERIAGLQAQLEEAKRELAKLRGELNERGRYVLHEVRPGAFCYRSQNDADDAAPMHFLCQLCFDSGIKSVLRHRPPGYWGEGWGCAVSKDHEILK